MGAGVGRTWTDSTNMRIDVRRGFLTTLFLGIASMAAAQRPPDPVPPAVISRNEARQATVRAVKLAEPLRIDGRLDESVYTSTPPITDFIQTLPRNGVEPTEKTEAWVTFDAERFYVSARCYDSAPPNKWVANEMRRDANQVRQNDHFGMMIDTFHDGRNGYVFYSNPVGGRIDLSEADEGNPNTDWNPAQTRATLQFIFLVQNVVTAVVVGLVAPAWWMAATLVVATVVGSFLMTRVPAATARLAVLGVAGLGGVSLVLANV